MRICRVTIGYPPRRCGWSNHVRYLTEHQIRQCHQVWLVHPQESDTPGPSPDAVLRVGLGPLAPFWGRSLVRILFGSLAAGKIRALQRKHGLDLIHVHGDIFEVMALRGLARQLGVPLVVTVHSGLNRRARYRVMAKRIWPQVDAAIAVSPDIARDLESLGVPRERIRVISSGVELAQFSPVSEDSRREARRALEIPESAFVVTSVGRLTATKGYDVLLEATRLLSEMPSLQVLIVGDGPLKSDLEKQARDLAAVHFAGSQPSHRVCSYLHAADLFVMPFVDQNGVVEGTPTAVIEAMATGLPILTTDSGGARYLVAAIEGITLVPQQNAAALALGLTRLAKDTELRLRLGQMNHERALSRDWASIAAEVSRFCESIVAQPAVSADG